MIDLTERQKAVYTFIEAYQRDSGYPPTMQEIAGHLKVSGNLGVMRHLAALEKKGYLTRTPGSSRSIRLTPRLPGAPQGDERYALFLPVVGTVRAGVPQLPEEDIQEYRSIDRAAARRGGTFFLRVKGDSMIGAAIREGDLALIRPQNDAANRDIVVALVDGEATLKRFCREDDRIVLQPENPDYQPLVIQQGEADIAIIGKAVAIYRELD